MATIYMIRHGHAAASFTDDLDPGLSELGRSQAVDSAKILHGLGPVKILSSPLKRAQETAIPFAKHSGISIEIENRVAEVPSPGLSLADRGPWLAQVMQGNWQDQSSALQQWQQDMVDCLLEINKDTAIFTHFVAINAMVSAAEEAATVLVFRPDNGSITTLDADGASLSLVSRGDEAQTKVN